MLMQMVLQRMGKVKEREDDEEDDEEGVCVRGECPGRGKGDGWSLGSLGVCLSAERSHVRQRVPKLGTEAALHLLSLPSEIGE